MKAMCAIMCGEGTGRRKMNEKARQALRASFGVWRERWEARERRLGLAESRVGRSEEVRDGEKADGTD